MNISYDKDIDYMEIFFKKEANYGDNLNDLILVFKSEKNDQIVGYSFEKASETVFNSDFLSLNLKLAAALRIFRARNNLTQEEVAKRAGMETRHYQRLESGEENTTLNTLQKVTDALPEQDFSKILKRVS